MTTTRESQKQTISFQQLTRDHQTEDQSEDVDPPAQIQRKYIYIYIYILICLIPLLVFFISINQKKQKNEPYNFKKTSPLQNDSQIIQIPHDPYCYTQGLSFLNGTFMLQSCGLYGQSYFHILQYNDKEKKLKEVHRSSIFDRSFFLQGSVKFPINNCIYILTWQENIVFKINGETFQEISRIRWQKQGWGLTHNNSHLIISDGSYNIYIVDQSLKILQTLPILDQNQNLIGNLNELQWVTQGQKQFIYCNIYPTEKIVKIDLSSGKVVKTFNFSPIISQERAKNHNQALNGIAYHTNTQKFIITGKQWGSLYRMSNLENVMISKVNI